MAKKKILIEQDESLSGRLGEFGSAVMQIVEEKGLPKERVIEVVEAALSAAYKRDYGKKSQVIKVVFDEVAKTAQYFLVKEVVDETTREFVSEEESDADGSEPESSRETATPVAESAEALEIARRHLNSSLPNLAAIDRAGLRRLEQLGASVLLPTLLKRVRHVVTETERVQSGMRAMIAGDWRTFGDLMTASGRSSAVDYDISHPRVEELVAAALSLPGVLGARMMGGGEGGTALILLPRTLVPALTDRLTDEYYRRHNMADAATFVRVFGFAPGAKIEHVD